mmetsp:Transcript_16366/g.19919  ORF Transcript_16366/g.19919 Transcript_16366/m.19919 type:complete len:349 (-) Transcript_16366:272-1318(-)
MFSFVLWWLAMMCRSFEAWFRCSSQNNDERSQMLPRIIKVMNTSAAKLLIEEFKQQNATDEIRLDQLGNDNIQRLLGQLRNEIYTTINLKEARTIDYTMYRQSVENSQKRSHAGFKERFVAIVELSVSRSSISYSIPDYIDWLPPRLARQCLASSENKPTFLDTVHHEPPPPFYAESFSQNYPIFSYNTLCPDECYAIDIYDELCRFCKKENVDHINSYRHSFDFDGGGTKFASLRDITIFPDTGHALLYGGHLLHAQQPVRKGERFFIQLVFDDDFCLQAESDLNYFFFSLILIIFIIVFPIIICSIDYEAHDYRKVAAGTAGTNQQQQHDDEKKNKKKENSFSIAH